MTNPEDTTMDNLSYQLEYEGEQTTRDPHFDMFCEVFTQYVKDLKSHQHWLVWPKAAESDDKGDAWRDFRGNRKQFNYLCDMTGVDCDAAREAIRAQLRAACAGGVQ